jgi:heptosyltransferase-2
MNLSRILIVRFSSLGDIVLISPVTRALRQAYPQTRMTVLVKRAYEPIARALPGVDDVEIFDSNQGLWPLAARVRSADYDLMVDLHANIRSHLLAWSGRAKQILRYHKRRLARMSIVYYPASSIATRHTVDAYLQVLQPLGISDCDRSPELLLPDTGNDEVTERLHTEGIFPSDLLMGIAPGASHPTKQWPASYFAELADYMVRTHDLNGTGRMDLTILPAAIQRCHIMVSNDSGPMHIASAVKTPVIGLFGPTHPRLGFSPLGSGDRALSLHLPCSPCSLHGEKSCKIHTHACLKDLTVECVISEVEQLLQRPV